MKNSFLKIAVFIVLFLNLYSSVNADVLPYYINSLRRYGIGYTLIQSPVVLRDTPKGNVVETLHFDFKTGETACLINKERCSQDEVFAVFSQSKQLAFLTTLDESENNVFVCFNQSERPICGWVEENFSNKFYGWKDFLEHWGKKYGLYMLKDIQKNDKILYSAPVKQSNSTGILEFPKYISPWLVRGNWVLVKVNDFNGQLKTGWLNYRGDNGKLKLFVRF